MIWKLLNVVLSLFLIISVDNYLEAKAGKINVKETLITRFCLSALKSKLNKNDFKKISSFTCECFYKKFNSGSSISDSQLFCKRKAFEKFNL